MASIAVDEACRELPRVITTERCKALLIDLVRVPSPQTALMESEPLLRQFIDTRPDGADQTKETS